jgi:hypothetical protein
MGGAVTELDLDPPAVHEVELLLLVVVVAAGLVAGRDRDRVDAERVTPSPLPTFRNPYRSPRSSMCPSA